MPPELFRGYADWWSRVAEYYRTQYKMSLEIKEMNRLDKTQRSSQVQLDPTMLIMKHDRKRKDKGT